MASNVRTVCEVDSSIDVPSNTRAASKIPPWGFVVVTLSLVGVYLYFALRPHPYGLDLSVYRDVVAYWHQGHDPYLRSFTSRSLEFTYPPFALIVLTPLDWMSFVSTQWALWTLSFAAATISVWIVLKDRSVSAGARRWAIAIVWACIANVLLEPVRSEMNYGQVELVLMLLVVVDLMVVSHRFRGVMLAVASAIKLTPLIFLLFLIFRRDYRSTVRAVASLLVLTLGTWIAWPALSQLFWIHEVVRPGRVGGVSYGGNQSWYAVVHRWPFALASSGPIWIFLCLLTVAAGSFAAWRYVNSNQRALGLVTVALVGLLISPISWSHHWVWVILIPPLLIGRRRLEIAVTVRILMWGVVLLTAVAPYWWYKIGIPAAVCDAVLPIETFGLLVTMATVEYRRQKRERLSPAKSEETSPAFT